MNEPSVKCHRRKLWFKLLVGIGMILGCYYALFRWQLYRQEQKLARVIEGIIVADPHWQFEDLLAAIPQTPDDQNLGKEINAILGNDMLGLHEMILSPQRNEWGKKYYQLYQKDQLEHYEAFLQQHPNSRLPDKLKRMVSGQLQLPPGPQAIQRMRRLSSFDHGHFDHRYRKLMADSLLPDVQGTRNIGNFLAWDAGLRVESGDPNDALVNVEAILHCCRVFDDDPFAISLLVQKALARQAARLVQRLLAQSDRWNAERLSELQSRFLHAAQSYSPKDSIRRLRAMIDKDLRTLQNGEVSLHEIATKIWRFPGSGLRSGWKWLDDQLWWIAPRYMIQPWARPQQWVNERIGSLQFHNRLMQVMELPDEEMLGGIKVMQSEGYRLTGFVCSTFGSVQTESEYESLKDYNQAAQTIRSYLNYKASCRAIAVVLACERFRIENGTWPQNWEQLVPSFSDKVLIDPWTGKPLMLKTLPDGIVIYSVGHNQKDDGGEVLPAGDGPDLGFRLWDPSFRAVDMNQQCQDYVNSQKKGQ